MPYLLFFSALGAVCFGMGFALSKTVFRPY